MCQITKNDSTIAFWEFDAVLYQETILSSGVFRRETASGFYPFGDATDLVRGRREGCGVADSSPSLKSDMPQH